MTLHELKTESPYFEDIFFDRKDFEVQKNDRDFKTGDIIKLIEFIPEVNHRCPRNVVKRIKYILEGGRFGIKKDYVILGLINIEKS